MRPRHGQATSACGRDVSSLRRIFGIGESTQPSCWVRPVLPMRAQNSSPMTLRCPGVAGSRASTHFALGRTWASITCQVAGAIGGPQSRSAGSAPRTTRSQQVSAVRTRAGCAKADRPPRRMLDCGRAQFAAPPAAIDILGSGHAPKRPGSYALAASCMTGERSIGSALLGVERVAQAIAQYIE